MNFLTRSIVVKKKNPSPSQGKVIKQLVVWSNDTGQFIAKKFVPQQNHKTLSPLELQFKRSQCHVNEAILAQVRSMNKVGIKTVDIMLHTTLQSGGYNNLLYQLRDIYNKVANARREKTLETNSEKELG